MKNARLTTCLCLAAVSLTGLGETTTRRMLFDIRSMPVALAEPNAGTDTGGWKATRQWISGQAISSQKFLL